MSYKKTEAPIARELKHAKALIKKKEHWIQGTFARDPEGIKCNPRSADAFQFCAVGALQHAKVSVISDSFLSAGSYLRLAAAVITGDELAETATFNDSHTHEEVMELYDIAIAWAQGEFDANT